MKPPRTYSEWLTLLERFGDGDDSTLEAMWEGSVEWTRVVAERWTVRTVEAFNARLRTLSDRLQFGLDRARGNHQAVASALLEARKRLVPLRSFLGLQCLPESVRSHLTSELTRWITQTQAALEKAAAGQRDDQGWTAKTIRDNSLTVFKVDAPKTAANGGPTSDGVQSGRPRRVIIT